MPDLPTRADLFQVGADEIFVRSAARPAGQRITPEEVYTEGSVAYVDFSADEFGECIIVYDAERGTYRNCADIEAGWQTLFPRPVPAGTTASDVMLHWKEEFRPDKWS